MRLFEKVPNDWKVLRCRCPGESEEPVHLDDVAVLDMKLGDITINGFRLRYGINGHAVIILPPHISLLPPLHFQAFYAARDCYQQLFDIYGLSWPTYHAPLA